MPPVNAASADSAELNKAARSERLPGLDAARALAVIAMVVGHTAHALLTDQARALSWVQTYWTFRGLTAPLFLFVSGWAVFASVDRAGATGFSLLRSRLGRVGLLLGLALLLRWPGWNVRGVFTGDVETWRHLIGYDALHCIGVSLFLGILVLSVVPPGRWRILVLGAIAVGVPLLTGPFVRSLGSFDLHWLLRATFIADARSPFALLPWTGYFFAGAFAGTCLGYLKGQWAKVAGLLVVGAVVTVSAWAWGVKNVPYDSPLLFAWRVGQVILIAAAATAVPLGWAKVCAPIGRSTLVIYVAHLPIVYGWSTIPGLAGRWGRTLEPLQVIATATVVFAVCFSLAVGLRRGRAAFEGWLRRRAATAPSVSPATGESPPS